MTVNLITYYTLTTLLITYYTLQSYRRFCQLHLLASNVRKKLKDKYSYRITAIQKKRQNFISKLLCYQCCFFPPIKFAKTILKSSKEVPLSTRLLKFAEESVILNGKSDINPF